MYYLNYSPLACGERGPGWVVQDKSKGTHLLNPPAGRRKRVRTKTKVPFPYVFFQQGSWMEELWSPATSALFSPRYIYHDSTLPISVVMNGLSLDISPVLSVPKILSRILVQPDSVARGIHRNGEWESSNQPSHNMLPPPSSPLQTFQKEKKEAMAG